MNGQAGRIEWVDGGIIDGQQRWIGVGKVVEAIDTAVVFVFPILEIENMRQETRSEK